MLIYSKERFVPTDINMMVLAAKDDDGYFYVHRSLYDQAVVIYDLYGENIAQLAVELTGSPSYRADVGAFISKAPVPIEALAPFLLFVKEPLTKFEDMVGAIHVMSGPINFRRLLQQDKAVRNIPSFSLSIKEEYELSWDRFFQTVLPHGAMNTSVVNPMAGTNTYTTPVVQTPDYVEEEDMSDDDLFDDDLAELEAMCAGFTASVNDDKKDEETPAPAPVSAPDPEPVPEPVTTPVKTGLDLLTSGGI